MGLGGVGFVRCACRCRVGKDREGDGWGLDSDEDSSEFERRFGVWVTVQQSSVFQVSLGHFKHQDSDICFFVRTC